MKLYKLKASVTDEMLEKIFLRRGEIPPATFTLNEKDEGWIFRSTRIEAKAWRANDGSCREFYIPPEWLEEVESGDGIVPENDYQAFELWFKGQDVGNSHENEICRSAWLAALEYERKRK